MHTAELLASTVVLFGSAIIVATFLRVIKIPSIIGYLLAGIAIGPSGWELIAPDRVEEFSEVGIVLLLFTVGLELSPRQLLQTGPRLLWATGLQFVLVGVLVLAGLTLFAPQGALVVFVLAVAVSLSSTAIVLKLLHDRGESESTVGVVTTGVLLLQDVIVIIVMLLLSTFQGEAQSLSGILLKEAFALAMLAAVVTAARYALPRVLAAVVRYGGLELTALFAVLTAATGAWAAGLAGWSLGLGACIAGLLLADADHRHQLVAEITPFRDVFNALFFISLGMQVDVEQVLGHFPLLTMAVLATIVLKSGATAIAARMAGWPLRVAIATGISLCTVSEFAYVLGSQAADIGVLPEAGLTTLIAYTVGTMLVGTLLFPLATPIAERLTAFGTRKKSGQRDSLAAEGAAALDSHVIVVGFGVTGHNLAQMLKSTRIPFCVLEMNPGLVRQARDLGALTVVGDATRMSILEHAGLERARALVVAINDTRAAEQIVAQANSMRPDLFTLIRARFVSQIDRLYNQGAKLVIPEDFETSIEIAAHLLKEFRIPSNIINSQIASIRAGGYGLLRGKAADRAMTVDLLRVLEQTVTETFYLEEDSPACNRNLRELDLRARSGASVIAVVRHGTPTPSPAPDFGLMQGDVLVLVGAHAQLAAAREVLGGRTASR